MFDGKIMYSKRVEKIDIYSTPTKKYFFYSEINFPTNIVTRTYLKELPVFITVNSDKDLSVTKEGIFIKGQAYDALTKVYDLIKMATNSIILIDGYINNENFDTLSIKNKGVTIKILTYDVSKSLETLAKAFNTQFQGLEIHTINDFHDRFLIIDETDFYHFGASFKDLATRKSFMFSKIEEDLIKKTLLDNFNDIWDNHSKKVI